MIYFTSKDEKHVMIIDHQTIHKLLIGDAVVSPDNLVIIAYTPDMAWTADELKKVFSDPEALLSPAKLDEILREGIARFQITRTDVSDTAKSTTTESNSDAH